LKDLEDEIVPLKLFCEVHHTNYRISRATETRLLAESEFSMLVAPEDWVLRRLEAHSALRAYKNYLYPPTLEEIGKIPPAP